MVRARVCGDRSPRWGEGAGIFAGALERFLTAYGRGGDVARMRIREITLRELRMKLVAAFETSTMRTDERRIVLVEANVDGVMGWGECVAGEPPAYGPETTATAWRILPDYPWSLVTVSEVA